MDTLKSLPARAALGFALVSGVTAAAVVTSSVLAEREADRREGMLLRYGDDLVQAAEAQASAERLVAAGRGYLLTAEPELLERGRRAGQQLDLALQAMDRTEARPSEQEELRQARLAAAHYRGLLEEILETSASEDRASLARTLRERLEPARQQLEETIATLVAHTQALELGARMEAARIRARTLWLTVALGGTALILSILLAWMFTGWLTHIHARERESTRRAKAALGAKEDILGIVAHDLRSPLNAIVLRAASIASRGTTEPVRASAESIGSTCRRMEHLISSLLDAASVEAGRLLVSKTRFRVCDLFSDLLDMFGPEASEKSVRLEQQLTPRDLAVRGDRERLFQVLSNLVANALRFTGEGGAIAVSAGEGEGVVRFWVRDTGPGIAGEHFPRIFERYWKPDKRLPGAGLGLYIARGIVSAHGGRIWAENNPGHGATFHFEIPTGSAAVGPAAALELPPPHAPAPALHDQPGHV